MFEWFKTARQLRENGVLGMNDRNYSVIAKYNDRSLYTLVDDKVKTKKLANNININTPKMIGIIEHQYDVKNFLKENSQENDSKDYSLRMVRSRRTIRYNQKMY